MRTKATVSDVTGSARFVRSHLRELAPYTPIEPFDVLSERLGRAPEEIVKLDANENPYGPPPEVVQVGAGLPFTACHSSQFTNSGKAVQNEPVRKEISLRRLCHRYASRTSTLIRSAGSSVRHWSRKAGCPRKTSLRGPEQTRSSISSSHAAWNMATLSLIRLRPSACTNSTPMFMGQGA